jgi:acetyl-CoA C-acetyltransferase
VSESNRWICFPYPKLMNAIIEVDQAAALVVMSEAEADRLGVPASKRVAFLGGAKAADAWTPTERPDFVSSAGYRAACKRALELAAVGLGEIDCFDFYSCFPSAVELATQELGYSLDDPRGLTLTGGLAHHGGPGNDYSMHALANAVDHLRESDARTAYVSALGGYGTKHAVSILSTDPERAAGASRMGEELELAPELVTGPECVDQPDGPGRIETYTVQFERDGSPQHGILVVRLDDGRRSVAHVDPSPEAFARLVESEGVGLRGVARPGGDGPNGFALEAH